VKQPDEPQRELRAARSPKSQEALALQEPVLKAAASPGVPEARSPVTV
jgi:hypothetical protein